MRGASILILDEPTAALSIDDAKALGETIRTFVRSGGAVFYISHKLNEVMEIADRITVMRRGRVVGRHKPEETSVAALAAEMVGELPGFGGGKGRAGSDAGQDLIDVAMGVREEARFSGARETFALSTTCRRNRATDPSRMLERFQPVGSLR